MKSICFLLVVSVLVLFSVGKASSQVFDCPTGCTEYEFTFWPSIGGCEQYLDRGIHVVYCCCFDASGPTYTATVIYHDWPNCFYRDCIYSNTERKNEFLRQLTDAMRADAFTRTSGCLSDIPPCDDPNMVPVRISIRIAKCWKDVNFWSSTWHEWILTSVRCPNTTAEGDKWYQVCKDFQTMQLRILSQGCNMLGNGNCSFEIPTIPPPGKTLEEPWETECYAPPCCP